VPEFSYDEFSGLFHDLYLKLGRGLCCRGSVVESSVFSLALGWYRRTQYL